jgi:hypothetical protein
MKLDGDRFSVTGVDASSRGPYSGGTFRMRTEDLPKLQQVLTQFAQG